jgi:fatty-acyl-CoA synthase
VPVDEAPLTPLSFLLRSADVWSDRPAVRDRQRSWTYAEHAERVCRVARVLRSQFGVTEGVRVATMLPNLAAMLEVHYAVPGAGGVLVPMNTRLTSADYAYILRHSGAQVVVAATTMRGSLEAALASMDTPPRVLWVDPDDGDCDYETLLESATPAGLVRPDDERALLSINYTSGTTGRPKGVMTSHRGAYLHSLGVIAEAGLTTRSAYLWTLPMFHCNGWAYTWAVTATGARHLCLPGVDPEQIWHSIHADGVTHLCAAPTVVTMLLEAAEASRCAQPVRLFVGGSPPSPMLLGRAERLNIDVTHLYGLTETYGPIAICAWNPGWDDQPPEDQARLRARQGVSTLVSQPLRVVDAQMRDVPRDGESLGEVVMQGNNVMAGYYHDHGATQEAFAGGWFHSGDLAVMHPDGFIEVRDRLKDVVISGGENIATVEIEHALVAHPRVSEAAVVGRPDAKWGEVPVAFVTVRERAAIDPDDLRGFLRARIAHFKVPRSIEIVDELPKTATGKIQKYALRQRVDGVTRGAAPRLASPRYDRA